MNVNKLLIRNRLGGTYEKTTVTIKGPDGTFRNYSYKRRVSNTYLDGSITTAKARQSHTTEIRSVTDPKELSEINLSFEQGKRELEATWDDNLAELDRLMAQDSQHLALLEGTETA